MDSKTSSLWYRASSRAEGAHVKLKQYLQVSTGDFRQVKDKICHAVTHEFKELKSKLSRERIRVPHNCNIMFFKDLVTNVSMFAMNELYKQYEMSRDGTMSLVCFDHFTSTMGLPCAHEIMKWKRGVLHISCIHPQWRIDTRSLTSIDRGLTVDEDFSDLSQKLEDSFTKWPIVRKEIALDAISKLVGNPVLLFSEPTITIQKGSSSKRRKESNSTRRDPLRFKYVEKTTRKCSQCKGVGHDIRKCPRKSESTMQSSADTPSLIDDGRTMRTLDLNMTPYLDFITFPE